MSDRLGCPQLIHTTRIRSVITGLGHGSGDLLFTNFVVICTTITLRLEKLLEALLVLIAFSHIDNIVLTFYILYLISIVIVMLFCSIWPDIHIPLRNFIKISKFVKVLFQFLPLVRQLFHGQARLWLFFELLFEAEVFVVDGEFGDARGYHTFLKMLNRIYFINKFAHFIFLKCHVLLENVGFF